MTGSADIQVQGAYSRDTIAVSSQAALIAFYAFIVAAVLWPLYRTQIPPLLDYPNHLARTYILAHIDGSSALHQFYAAAWGPIPNLAADFVLVPLQHWLPAYDAGRVALAASAVLPICAVTYLHYVLWGRVGVWPAAAALFVYNQTLIYGFLAFFLTLSLALLAFAAWVHARSYDRRIAVPVFAGVAIALWLGHLFAFGVYALLVATYELQRAWDMPGERAGKRADLLVSAAQFIPAMALWAYSAHSGDAPAYETIFGGLDRRLDVLRAPTMTYAGRLDTVTLLVAVVTLVGGFTSRALRLARPMLLPIAAVAVLAALMPAQVVGSAYAHLRLPVALAFLLVAATQWQVTAPYRIAGTLVLVALVGARGAQLAHEWNAVAAEYGEFRTAIQLIPEGARVLVSTIDLSDRGSPPRRADGTLIARQFYAHLHALTVIDRNAFMPLLFTQRAVQPLSVTDAFAPINADTAQSAESMPPGTRAAAQEWMLIAATADECARPVPRYVCHWTDNFDYVVLYHFGYDTSRGVKLHLRPVYHGSFFDIDRIVR